MRAQLDTFDCSIRGRRKGAGAGAGAAMRANNWGEHDRATVNRSVVSLLLSTAVVVVAAAGRGSRWPNPNQFRTPDEAS